MTLLLKPHLFLLFFALNNVAVLLTSTAADDFDLADALDPSNDISVKDKNKGGRNALRPTIAM